jgi:hypothetical protein
MLDGDQNDTLSCLGHTRPLPPRMREGCASVHSLKLKKRLSPGRPLQGVLARFADHTRVRLRGRLCTFSARPQGVDVELHGRNSTPCLLMAVKRVAVANSPGRAGAIAGMTR